MQFIYYARCQKFSRCSMASGNFNQHPLSSARAVWLVVVGLVGLIFIAWVLIWFDGRFFILSWRLFRFGWWARCWILVRVVAAWTVVPRLRVQIGDCLLSLLTEQGQIDRRGKGSLRGRSRPVPWEHICVVNCEIRMWFIRINFHVLQDVVSFYPIRLRTAWNWRVD